MSESVRHPLVVCGAHPGHGEEVVQDLVEFGYEVCRCESEEALIEAASALRPRAIVYELHHQLPVDLAILSLVRRVLPDVPLVVVAGGLAEQAVRVLRAVHPTILDCDPVDRSRLKHAVQLAVRRSRPATKHAHVET